MNKPDFEWDEAKNQENRKNMELHSMMHSMLSWIATVLSMRILPTTKMKSVIIVLA